MCNNDVQMNCSVFDKPVLPDFRYLSEQGGGLPHLRYLDLSGLPNISQSGLNGLVSECPRLQPEMLFYCDNISYGPYSSCANGCQNVGSASLVCCRRMM